jgi:hypothetical protein
MPSTTHAESTSQESELLQRAITLWRKAQVLYQGCSWEGRPEALAVAKQIAAGNPECEPLLSALLLDRNQLGGRKIIAGPESRRSGRQIRKSLRPSGPVISFRAP